MSRTPIEWFQEQVQGAKEKRESRRRERKMRSPSRDGRRLAASAEEESRDQIFPVQTRRPSFADSFNAFIMPSSGTGSGKKVPVEKTLLGIISNGQQCAHLQAYLDARFMGEGLRALVEIVKFEAHPSLEEGELIFNRFVKDSDSGDCVTLALEIQVKISDALEAGELPSFFEMKLDILMSLSLVLAEFLYKFQMPTVEECFAVQKFRDMVLSFAKSCFMEESVLFLFLVDEYERLEDVQIRQQLGGKILEQFFDSNARRELNVSTKVTKSIDLLRGNPDWPTEAFEEAKSDQMKLFVFDIYPRFISSLAKNAE